MRNFFQQKGTIIIIAFLTLGILLILGSYFLTFTLIESKISKSYEAGTKTYYLAEAGINEAIWKLKNDPVWANDFIDEAKNPYPDGTYWSANFTQNNVFGGSYTVSIQNTARARGEVISLATIPFSASKTAQRIVKTTAFKSLSSPTEDSAVFSGGTSENIDISYTYLKVDKGNLFSNNNLNISGGSIVRVLDNPGTEEILEGKVLAAHNLIIKDISQIADYTAICAKNQCTENCEGYVPGLERCPPDPISVPLVDFDSDSPNSFKSRALIAQNTGQCQILCQKSGEFPYQCSNKCIFTATEFEDLLWEVGQEGILTLNNVITYVTGPIELRGGRHLIVNGTLVADDNLNIGKRYKWKGDEGFSQITINQPGPEKPSGLLTKRKIDFGLYSSFQDISITGVIYANDEISLVSVPRTFNVIGGVIARKLSFTSLWQWLNITLDVEKILYSLGYKIDDTPINPTYSPIITVEHWEESY